MKQVSDTAVALAALSICQNILAVLLDRNVITREDIEELLADAAGVQHSLGDGDLALNEEAAEVIQEVMDGLISSEGR